MRMSRHFGETLRAAPADVEVAGHRLLLRAGYVRQLAAGVFSYLPLGLRALRRIESIVREEMDAIGGQEIAMPMVHPAELWQETGRWYEIGDEMARFRDRAGREMVLGMTHEEVVGDLVRRDVHSYRQLPMLVYQIQTKFRDEPRPRAGLIRAREFTMKDSYSLDLDQAGLELQYRAHYEAYLRIFRRAGLGEVLAVRSDPGMMGGREAHEFMFPSPIGEDVVVRCAGCGDAANLQVARFRKPAPPAEAPRPAEKVPTPGAPTIRALAELLGVPESRTAKVVFFLAAVPAEGATAGERAEPPIAASHKLVLALVRGDMEVNEAKLGAAIGARTLQPASEAEIRAVGAEPGYASPVGVDRSRTLVVVDDLVAVSPNLVSGANQEGHHLLNVNVGRDYAPDVVADLASAPEGAPCAACGAPLAWVRAVEVGNIFQLGTRYTEALGATYLDASGRAHPVVMGSYGIGIGRLLACLAEAHQDERGLRLPPSVAPFDLHLVCLARRDEPQIVRQADELYERLRESGLKVLYDDRDLTAGVKFTDADLIGIPVRATLSQRSLGSGGLELKRRDSGETRVVPLGEAAAAVRESLMRL